MERLQKVMAQAGVASRRKSEEMILSGIVKVNGKVVKELGYKVSSSDSITVNDILLEKEDHVYYVLNKPTGYVSTVSDEKGRKTVLDLFDKKDLEKRIYPIGRLDYDTAGVLILTNDGDFANGLLHPKNEIEKEYMARVEGLVTKLEIIKLEKGVLIDGYKTKPCVAKVVSSDKRNNTSLLRIIIHEGKNHQVRLMCDAIGHQVKKLTRVRFASVTVDDIPRGSYRPLKIYEIKQLQNL